MLRRSARLLSFVVLLGGAVLVILGGLGPGPEGGAPPAPPPGLGPPLAGRPAPSAPGTPEPGSVPGPVESVPLVILVRREDGRPVPGAAVILRAGKEAVARGETGRGGRVVFEAREGNAVPGATAGWGNEIAPGRADGEGRLTVRVPAGTPALRVGAPG